MCAAPTPSLSGAVHSKPLIPPAHVPSCQEGGCRGWWQVPHPLGAPSPPPADPLPGLCQRAGKRSMSWDWTHLILSLNFVFCHHGLTGVRSAEGLMPDQAHISPARWAPVFPVVPCKEHCAFWAFCFLSRSPFIEPLLCANCEAAGSPRLHAPVHGPEDLPQPAQALPSTLQPLPVSPLARQCLPPVLVPCSPASRVTWWFGPEPLWLAFLVPSTPLLLRTVASLAR